ncbi:DUF3192 domain-containing protein [Neiella marina]|uniref:DUF3192 domain-containing protein n=1 Tax=Neiella holothuriorum TaxID=2870530 RepID=A0ABS7EDB2_9GAMM|nr:DUF3192 domain-containing protein [Neiella holothuriorum]MBW8189908.1 DUF3192 domain-containing protein [Neiella holothuriorum]
MKRTVIAIAAGLIAINTLAGCVVAVGNDDWDHSSDWQDKQQHNRGEIANLDLGINYDQVLTIMGTPDFTERLTVADKDYQILYYQTNSKKSDGKVTKSECTPLLFTDKKLTGWGDTALQQLTPSS